MRAHARGTAASASHRERTLAHALCATAHLLSMGARSSLEEWSPELPSYDLPGRHRVNRAEQLRLRAEVRYMWTYQSPHAWKPSHIVVPDAVADQTL